MLTENLFRLLRGNQAAVDFFLTVLRIVEAWDALIDKDEPISDEQIDIAFIECIMALPNNTFYSANRATLQPIFFNAIMNWKIATRAERIKSTKERLNWAFVIRSSYIDMLVMSATLIGGLEWGVLVGLEAHDWVHGEGFPKYLTALATEKKTREAKNGM